MTVDVRATAKDGADNMDGSTSTSWTALLRSAASATATPARTVLVLGDSQSGKKTVVRHLLGDTGDSAVSEANSARREFALSYRFTQVRDDEGEEPALDLGVYKLAGNPQYETLLDALWKDDAAPTEFDANGNETCAATLSEALRNTAVIIVLDWERPWSFLESLERYMRIVRSSIERVLGDGNGDGALEIAACQARIEAYIKEYVEPPSTASSAALSAGNQSMAALDATVESVHQSLRASASTSLLMLTHGSLSENVGVPIVVVCAKSDHTFKLPDLKDEHFDLIQQALRVQCLKYGAALFYASHFRPETYANLRRYVIHRLLWNGDGEKGATSTRGTFPVRAEVVERDLVFVPAGWDSWSKIKILDDTFDCQAFYGDKHLALYAEAIESPTAVSSSMHSASVAVPVEDEQTFLERQAKLLQKAGAAMPSRETSNMNAPAGTASSTSATSLLAASAASGTRRLSAVTSSADAAKNTSSGTAQNAVLANFFQSLLNKKGGTTPGVAASSATTTGATSLSTGGSGSTRVGAATSLASTTNRPVSRTAAAAELERLRAAAQRPSGV